MSFYKSTFLAKAQNELLNALEWYEDRQVGLGTRFKNEIYNCLKKIEKSPQKYPLRPNNFRERRINIFPYLIIYRIEESEKLILISSIFHTSRNPQKKYKQ